MRRLRLRLIAPPLFLGAFFLYPLWLVLRQADGKAWQWVFDEYARARILTGLEQAVYSTLITIALGLALAWFYHRREVPFARLQMAIHQAPFVLPVFVVVYGTRQMVGPHGWLTLLGLPVFTPMAAVVAAHVYYNYGFAARLLYDGLERRPTQFEEAAATLGASKWHIWRRVNVPLLAPTFLATTLLVFLFTFTSFGVVKLLGENQVHTMETLLYQNTKGIFPKLNRSAALGLLQMAVNVSLLWLYLRLQSRRFPSRLRVKAQGGLKRGWLFLALGLTPAIAVLLGGFRVGDTWTLEGWRALLIATHPDHVHGFNVWWAINRSLLYAGCSAILSFMLAWWVAQGATNTRRGRLMQLISALPLGTSSLLVGLGMVFAFGASGIVDLRGTFWVIVIAHTLVSFPFAARVLVPAWASHPRRLDEAAQVLGASPLRIFWRVQWPLMRGPMLAALAFSVAMSLGDFGASLLLMDQDQRSLGVWIGYHGEAFNLIMKTQATALSGILMVLSAVAFLSIEWLGGSDA